jgi:hypothetical protein
VTGRRILYQPQENGPGARHTVEGLRLADARAIREQCVLVGHVNWGYGSRHLYEWLVAVRPLRRAPVPQASTRRGMGQWGFGEAAVAANVREETTALMRNSGVGMRHRAGRVSEVGRTRNTTEGARR